MRLPQRNASYWRTLAAVTCNFIANSGVPIRCSRSTNELIGWIQIMFGPKPKGFWINTNGANLVANHQSLQVGQRYRVIHEFEDYDRHVHPVGDTWTFLGHSFLPYEDGMSFFVSVDNQQEWLIRLQWRREAQAHILDNLPKYLAATV